MLDHFEEVDLQKSILYKKVYHSIPILENHIKKYLNEKYDVISIFKFSEHLPDITTVWLNLQILQLFQEESVKLEKKDIGNIIPFKIIRILEKDWFFEICAALGGLGGLAAVLQFIYTIIKDRKVKTTRQVTHTRGVPTGGGFVQKQSYVTNETRYIDTIGSEQQFSTEKISDYYQDQLEEIQIHTKEGKLYRITKKQIIQISQK